MVSLNKLPGVAQPAIQEGKYIAGVIKARLEGDKAPAPFQYHDKGSMATIGHKHAVADAFGLKLTGLPAYVMWGLVHVAYLIDWGNRLGTLYAWSRALYAINNRGNRVITFHQASDELGQGRIRAVQPAPEVSSSQAALGRSAPAPARATGPGQPAPGHAPERPGRNGPTSA
jgi:NADH dehydrogenase